MFGKGVVKLETDLTLRCWNVDCTKLLPGSHQKVLVTCTKCGELFGREYRNLGQFHACPTHIVKDGKRLKWCSKCQQFLVYELFTINNSRCDKLSSCCKACQSLLPSRRKMHLKFASSRKTVNGWIKWAISRKRSECKKNGIHFDIDDEYLLKQYDDQDGKCFYTKIPLDFGNSSLRSASLERLDSSIGYVRGNVVLSSKAMNWAKNSTTLQDFQLFLSELVSNLSNYVRLETKKLDPEAALPYRKRTSDAGYDVSSIEDIIIKPHTMCNVNTGIIISPPDGVYYSVEGRSSLWMRGIVPASGIIDGTYQGHLIIALINNSDVEFQIKKGDRIAQLIMHKIVNADFALVDEFSPIQDGRSTNGFGSTGRGSENGLSDGLSDNRA